MHSKQTYIYVINNDNIYSPTCWGTPRGEIVPYVTSHVKYLYASSAFTQKPLKQANIPRKKWRKMACFMVSDIYIPSSFCAKENKQSKSFNYNSVKQILCSWTRNTLFRPKYPIWNDVTLTII